MKENKKSSLAQKLLGESAVIVESAGSLPPGTLEGARELNELMMDGEWPSEEIDASVVCDCDAAEGMNGVLYSYNGGTYVMFNASDSYHSNFVPVTAVKSQRQIWEVEVEVDSSEIEIE